MLHLKERFLSSTMQEMELAGWKMSGQQADGVSVCIWCVCVCERGVWLCVCVCEKGVGWGVSITSFGSVHSSHQNAGSESCSSPVDAAINCTAFWFSIVCYSVVKLHFCGHFVLFGFVVLDWLIVLCFSIHVWEHWHLYASGGLQTNWILLWCFLDH